MTATLEEARIKTVALQCAINAAIPQLRDELGAIKTTTVAVDKRSGYRQSGYIDSAKVRSMVGDISIEAAQCLPESVQLYMPDKSRPYMSHEALEALISHLNDISRAL